MKTVGLIGGMSWESTALYYQLLNQGVRERLGGLHSAKILLASVDFQEIEAMQQQGQWQEAGSLLAELGLGLEQAGADCILLCTNTMHKVAPRIEDVLSIPFLHLADATARVVKERGYTRVGLLGTSFTMEEDFYCGRLRSRGLTVLVPDQERRNEVNRIIFDELCCGQVLAESAKTYLETIDALAEQGAQAVILGCTEIGMLVSPEQSSLPLVDTTRVHVEAAIELMLSS
jgi:aspartate racemase